MQRELWEPTYVVQNKILYHGICGMQNITFGLLLTLKRKDYMEGKLKEGEDANKLAL